MVHDRLTTLVPPLHRPGSMHSLRCSSTGRPQWFGWDHGYLPGNLLGLHFNEELFSLALAFLVFAVTCLVAGWFTSMSYFLVVWLRGLVTRSSALRSDRGRLRSTAFTGVSSIGLFSRSRVSRVFHFGG
jgi:hypothetical protein